MWSLQCVVYVADNDGIVSAACLAALAALHAARIPDVTVVGGGYILHSLDDRQPVALRLMHMPIVVTFALFNNSTGEDPFISILDPCRKEEMIMHGRLLLSSTSSTCFNILKTGSVALPVADLADCFAVAKLIESNWIKKIREQRVDLNSKDRMELLTQMRNLYKSGENIVQEKQVVSDNLKSDVRLESSLNVKMQQPEEHASSSTAWDDDGDVAMDAVARDFFEAPIIPNSAKGNTRVGVKIKGRDTLHSKSKKINK